MAKGDRMYLRALKEANKESPNTQELRRLIFQAWSLGNPKATYAVATWYLHGENVKKDVDRAIKLLKEASKHDIPDAYFDLAVCYEKGVGVTKDLKLAFENYLSAALYGDSQAFYEIGRCYYYGVGVTEDKGIAEVWLRKAEELGIDT